MVAFLLGSLAFVEAALLVPIVFYGLLACLIIWSYFAIEWTPEEMDPDRQESWFTPTILTLVLMWVVGWKWFGFTPSNLKDVSGDLIFFVAYILAGISWSVGKWYFFLKNVRDHYVEFKADYIRKFKLSPDFLDEGPEKTRDDFCSALERNFRSYDPRDHKDISYSEYVVSHIQPQASKNKASITKWIMCWPLSFVWTMLNDPVRKLANAIFNSIKKQFQAMSDRMFKGI
jgi:hypothetical protein